MTQTSSVTLSAMRSLLSAALAFAVVSDTNAADKFEYAIGQTEYYDVHNVWGQHITTILSSRDALEPQQGNSHCSASRMYSYSEQLSRYAQERHHRRRRSLPVNARRADGVPTVDMCEDKGWKDNKHTGKDISCILVY